MIRSPVDFLPLRIRLLTNFATIRSWNFGSGRIFRFSTSRRRGISTFSLARALCAVLRAALLAPLDADRVEGAANDVVAHAREVLHAATADEDHRVLLEVVPDAGDVARHLEAIGEPDAGDLAEGRVRLLGSRSVDAHADPALLRRLLERGRLLLDRELLAPAAHQLADRRHRTLFPTKTPLQTAGGANRRTTVVRAADYTDAPSPVKTIREVTCGPSPRPLAGVLQRRLQIHQNGSTCTLHPPATSHSREEVAHRGGN